MNSKASIIASSQACGGVAISTANTNTQILLPGLHLANGFAAQPKVGRPKRPPTAFCIKWAAGFVDGEGCICIAKQQYPKPRDGFTYRLSLSIVQNNRQVLDHLRLGLGTHGFIYEIERLLSHNKQLYTLNYTGRHAVNALTQLQPHLIRKQLEARTAIEYWTHSHCGTHPGRGGWSTEIKAIRERFYKKLKSLK